MAPGAFAPGAMKSKDAWGSPGPPSAGPRFGIVACVSSDPVGALNPEPPSPEPADPGRRLSVRKRGHQEEPEDDAKAQGQLHQHDPGATPLARAANPFQHGCLDSARLGGAARGLSAVAKLISKGHARKWDATGGPAPHSLRGSQYRFWPS